MRKKISVMLVRGAFFNLYEGQNYDLAPHINLCALTSRAGGFQSQYPFPVIRSLNLSDLVDQPFIHNTIIAKAGKFLSHRLLGDWHLFFDLKKTVTGFDIVHTADPHYGYSYQLAHLRAENKISCLVTTAWETIPHNNEGTFLKRKHKQYVLKHSDCFICYTGKARKVLIEEGVDGKKITVIPLGVDLTRFYPKKKNRNIIEILFVGRLVPEKGMIQVLETFSYEIKKYENLTLRIVGNGPLEREIRRWIDAYGFSKTVSLEQKSYEEIPAVYQNADILIAPSLATKTWEEQYGMVLVEAMASGLPIISTNTGAIPEVVGEAGILCEPNNPLQLQKSIEFLLDDGKRREKIGTIGRSRAITRYDAKKTASALITFYETICSHSDKK